MNVIEKKGFKFFCREYPRFDDEYCAGEVVENDTYKMNEWKFKNATIVDIGANVGTFSIPASKYGTVYAYEPGRENFEILTMNIQANNADVKAFNVAVGKEGNDVIENCSGHSRLVSVGGEGGNPCKVISFDEIVKQVGDIDLLKMDCEGGEYDIVEYASDESLSRVKQICGELHSWFTEFKDLEEYKERHKDMIAKLERHFDMQYTGYKNSTFFGKRKCNQ